MRRLSVGSLFSGIGGFDLGFEQAGMKTIWMCERDKHCLRLLRSKWKSVKIYDDVRKLLIRNDVFGRSLIPRPDVIIGGDPCPAHSGAKGAYESCHPDLSGWFLAVVGGFSPRWVVRENVPSPVTIEHFAITLEVLGYRTCIIWTDADAFTAQSRKRAFIVGCSSKEALQRFSFGLAYAESSKSSLEIRGAASCLTAQSHDSAWRQNFVWEYKRGLRCLLETERERLAGFPDNWTEGFSSQIRNKMWERGCPCGRKRNCCSNS